MHKKMKKIINLILCFAVISALASSCDNLLKPESPSTYETETVYSNYNLAEGTIFGITEAFCIDKSYRNRFLPWYGYNTDIEWYNTYNPGGDQGKSDIGIYDCKPTNGQLDEAEGCYTLMYTAIERANLAIEGLRKYGNTAEDANMAYLLGEALTLRAMVYYDLCKAWGDVPARFEPVTSETTYLPKSSREVIFKQLLTDLDEAISYLPYPGTTAATRRTDRINKVFAEGLYARIALMASGYALRPAEGMVGTGDLGSVCLPYDAELSKDKLYPKALDYLKDAISNGGCHLEPDYEAYWKRQNAKQNLTFDGETLYVIPFGDKRGQWNNYFAVRADAGTEFNTYTSARGGAAGPLPYLWWKFDEKDVRRDLTCANYRWDDATGGLIPTGIASWYFAKYRYDWQVEPASNADDGIKPVVMRYSDILLMAAEIENELSGPTTDAKNWLLAVRSRAFKGSEDAAEAYVNAISGKEAFFDAIVDERAFEFCGEFLRKADLIRWNLLKTKLDEAKAELRALRDHTGYYAGLPDNIYTQYDEATHTITFYGFRAGENDKPKGNWDVSKNYYAKVADEKGKDTGLYDGRIDGLYAHGDQMEWYMYWPIFSNQITSSVNKLVNDYYYE